MQHVLGSARACEQRGVHPFSWVIGAERVIIVGVLSAERVIIVVATGGEWIVHIVVVVAPGREWIVHIVVVRS